MKEMHAVVGFLSDKATKAIGTKGAPSEPLEIRVGDDSNLYVRIQPKDIAGVLTGASKKGETSVQVLLKENAAVETITRAKAADFLKPIRDFTFVNFRPPINVIYIDPIFIDKLVSLK